MATVKVSLFADISAQQSLLTCSSVWKPLCSYTVPVTVQCVLHMHAHGHPSHAAWSRGKIKHCVRELHTVCPRPLFRFLPYGLALRLGRYMYVNIIHVERKSFFAVFQAVYTIHYCWIIHLSMPNYLSWDQVLTTTHNNYYDTYTEQVRQLCASWNTLVQ